MKTLAEQFSIIKLTKNGIQIGQEKMPYQEWAKLGKELHRIRRWAAWAIGDWLNYGEQRYGEMYAQALEDTQYSYSTLSKMKYVSSRFEMFRRAENLSWSHHVEVAALPRKDQDKWLKRAEAEDWSKSDLRGHLLGKDKKPPQHMLKIHAEIYEAITAARIGVPCEEWARRVVASARILDGILAGQLEVLGLDKATNVPRYVKREIRASRPVCDKATPDPY